jgi:hypothetical protein
MLHRQALLSRNMNGGLQTVFQAVVRVVNYAENCPLKGRLFAKLCNDTEAEHTALLYCCATRWLSRAQVRVFELKVEVCNFLSDCNNSGANL